MQARECDRLIKEYVGNVPFVLRMKVTVPMPHPSSRDYINTHYVKGVEARQGLLMPVVCDNPDDALRFSPDDAGDMERLLDCNSFPDAERAMRSVVYTSVKLNKGVD